MFGKYLRVLVLVISGLVIATVIKWCGPYVCRTVWTSLLPSLYPVNLSTASADNVNRVQQHPISAKMTTTQSSLVHTITEEDTTDKRVFVIGDVHGCYDILIKLLLKADILQPGPTPQLKDDVIVVFVGDLVNKGPDSLGVLEFVMTTPGVYSVRGNHEDYWIGLHKAALMVASGKAQIEHIEFIRSLPYVIKIPRFNALIVHAGLMPHITLDKQPVEAMTLMRNLVHTKYNQQLLVPYSETDIGVHWASLWPGPEHVYFGHDARRGRDSQGNPRVQRFPLVTGLDTRCVKGGMLTGVFLPVEREEFYSIPCGIVYDNS